MGSSERNRKVAINRWKKIHEKEKNSFSTNTESKILKATILGMLAGDGSVQIRREKSFLHYQLDFFPDDKEMLDYYLDSIYSIYKKFPNVKNLENYYSVRLTSKTIVNDLIKISQFGLVNWIIPERFLLDNDLKKAWLRGFFSAEAYVGPRSIKIQTINEKGMQQVSELLRYLEIEHKFYTYLPKNCHSQTYIIVIMKIDARRRFFETIGFCHSKKNTALGQSLDL